MDFALFVSGGRLETSCASGRIVHQRVQYLAHLRPQQGRAREPGRVPQELRLSDHRQEKCAVKDRMLRGGSVHSISWLMRMADYYGDITIRPSRNYGFRFVVVRGKT